MPDVIGVLEMEERRRDGEGGHHSATSCNREVNAAPLLLEAANQAVDSVYDTICTEAIYNVAKRLVVVLQDV